MSSNKLIRKLEDKYTPPCFQLNLESNRQAVKQLILKRRFTEQIKHVYGKLLFYKYFLLLKYK